MDRSSKRIRWIARIASSLLALGSLWGAVSCGARKNPCKKSDKENSASDSLTIQSDVGRDYEADSLSLYRPRLMYGVPNVPFNPQIKIDTEDSKKGIE